MRTSVDELIETAKNLSLLSTIGFSLLELTNEVIELFSEKFESECRLLSV